MDSHRLVNLINLIVNVDFFWFNNSNLIVEYISIIVVAAGGYPLFHVGDCVWHGLASSLWQFAEQNGRQETHGGEYAPRPPQNHISL